MSILAIKMDSYQVFPLKVNNKNIFLKRLSDLLEINRITKNWTEMSPIFCYLGVFQVDFIHRLGRSLDHHGESGSGRSGITGRNEYVNLAGFVLVICIDL